MTLYARHRIDVGLRHLAFAAGAALRPGRRAALASAVERVWSPEGGAVACLSARSAFDLVLSALDLPRGSEVLVSAVTIPDMAAILAAHGLVPVPVDLDPATLAPRPELLERLRTGRTTAVLVAHLFGGRFDMAPVTEFCARHRLPLLEDCAQSFLGPGETGSAWALASFFSFGPIKTATALGGGLVRVRDDALLARMRTVHAAWPVQGRGAYARRTARIAGLATLQRRFPYRLVAAACGPRLDRVVGGSARSFPGGTGFRHQPSAPLLALLLRRLRTGDGGRLRTRAARGEEVARALEGAYDLPGRAQPLRTHWLFPVVADDPPRLIADLRAEGFDASGATSALVAVPPPHGRPEAEPVAARAMLDRVVFLPVYPELPARALRRLLQATMRSHWTTATSSPAATATSAGVGAAGPLRSSMAVLPPPGIDAGSVS